MILKLIPLRKYPLYLNGDELLPGYYIAEDHHSFASFLLQKRFTPNLLSTALKLADYLEAISPFRPIRAFLYGDICRLPHQEVRGRLYLQTEGGLVQARQLSAMKSQLGILLKESSSIHQLTKSESVMGATTRIITEASDINSSVDKFHRKRTLVAPPSSPIVWLKHPSGTRLLAAIETLCQQR